MFVCNFRIDKKLLLKVLKYFIIISVIIIFVLTIYAIFKDQNNSSSENNETPNLIELNTGNYTNFLKECHNNLKEYIGYNVKVTGYVYRMPDFNDNQFVLARTMLTNSNSQAVVVGILCESDLIKSFDDYSWVNIEGTIESGDYHGEIPVLKVSKISKTKMPEEEFVYEPID